MYLDLPIKQTDLRGQLAGIVGANPSASFMYIYDVKARLRDLKDDLVANPWKRPVPLDASSFKKVVHGLWRDPSAMLAGIHGHGRNSDFLILTMFIMSDDHVHNVRWFIFVNI